MKDLILALDIGNTSIHLGVFTYPSHRGIPELIARENILTEKAEKFLKQWQKRRPDLPRRQTDPCVGTPFTNPRIVSSVRLALMASTHPKSNALIEHWVKEVFRIKPLKVREDFKIPMPILVDEPSQVGADRLLNAWAAHYLTSPDIPPRRVRDTLVIDFGTAITLDIVSKAGEFLGGVIAPGITSMARALHQDCALLPLIQPRPVDPVRSNPDTKCRDASPAGWTSNRVDRAIGKNTEQAMQSGLYLGTVGSIQYLVQRISKELKKRPYIIATGSDARLMKPGLPFIKKIIPDLTLKGLVLAYLSAAGRESV